MKRFIFACSVFFVLACSGRSFEVPPVPENPQPPVQPEPALREGDLRADGDTERIFADLPLIEACGLEQPCRMKYARTEAE